MGERVLLDIEGWCIGCHYHEPGYEVCTASYADYRACEASLKEYHSSGGKANGTE